MDNKISFKANLISNGVVNKKVVAAFEKATKAFPNDSVILTKGCVDDGLEGCIIATMQSAKNFAEDSTALIIKPSGILSDDKISTKLVKGFKMMLEEASMNQKKYWVEKEMERASALVNEQTKKSSTTSEKGFLSISNAYKKLAERSAQKVDDLRGKIGLIEKKFAGKLTQIAGDDKDLQSFSVNILSK